MPKILTYNLGQVDSPLLYFCVLGGQMMMTKFSYSCSLRLCFAKVKRYPEDVGHDFCYDDPQEQIARRCESPRWAKSCVSRSFVCWRMICGNSPVWMPLFDTHNISDITSSYICVYFLLSKICLSTPRVRGSVQRYAVVWCGFANNVTTVPVFGRLVVVWYAGRV